MAVKVGVHGAGGRMGQRVVALASIDSRFKVVAALEAKSFGRMGMVCLFPKDCTMVILLKS